MRAAIAVLAVAALSLRLVAADTAVDRPFANETDDCSCATGQSWLDDLTHNIHSLTSGIQRNVAQLNRQVQDTVNTETARAHRLAHELSAGNRNTRARLSREAFHRLAATFPIESITRPLLGAGSVQVVNGGGNVVVTDDRGTRIAKSGRTSNGHAYVYESWSSVAGDTLRTVVTIRYPAANVTKVFGYTLDLADVHAKPVPVEDSSP